MFSWLQKKFFGKASVAEPQLAVRPEANEFNSISFVVQARLDGTVQALLRWPRPKSPEEFLAIANNTAMLLYGLSEGRFYALMQQSIGEASSFSGLETVGQAVFEKLNALRDLKVQDEALNNDMPAVDPEEVFSTGNPFNED